ncbi:retinol dehydrogenase 12-like isoform X1 [Sinocyclocheilus rhinocerous]|uniref:retinol dehydrogenase 12-like isoform X1 n=1 Tax=Sinocyclocheilus rhinocerous TaxID=307959 RepID=UPI0007B90DCB|nr:PREDICTED: retinol dehydrogenase 12-like isoform X1 [Sinocyclocheilus rhinocerous]
MNWQWSDMYSHPLWMVSAAILAIIVRAQRKAPWNPRACPVKLKGKTAIVTGANTGIGKFIALDFARRGARVILACRSEARGTAALQEIRESTGNQNVHLRLLDTSSLDSVRKFAARIVEEEKELHMLVNNAGASGGMPISLSLHLSYIHLYVHTNQGLLIPTGLPSKITADGLEITFATNHVGPFLLTSLLLDLLKESAPARIVNVSSMNHWKGEVNFHHFRGHNLKHVMDAAYNQTKLHNVIWTNELARRLQGTGVTANSVHPGVVMTDVMRNYNFIIRFLFNLVGFFFFKVS